MAIVVLTCAFGTAIPEAQNSGAADADSKNSEHTRTYCIAADEVDWDYAPSGTDQIHGTKYHYQDDPASKGMLNPNTTVYRKALFREYTDSTFTTLKPRSHAWEHLGILAPLIRAEVGDSIRVVFKNNASRPYSVHPHVVFYLKDSEGAGYEDGTEGGTRRMMRWRLAGRTHTCGSYQSELALSRGKTAPRSGSTTRMWMRAAILTPA